MTEARAFPFSGYGLQEYVIGRESGTLDLLVVLETH
jgi:hypothetical protein